MVNKATFFSLFLFFSKFIFAQNTISYPAINNGTCANTFNIGAINLPYSLTENSIPSPSSTQLQDGLWYTFIGNGENIFIRFDKAIYMSSLSVYKGNSCVDKIPVSFTQTPQAPCNTCYRTAIFQTEIGAKYYLRLFGGFGLPNELTLSMLNSTLSSNDTNLKYSDFSIYPNPAKDYIQLNQDEKIIDFTIINSEGKIIRKTSKKGNKIYVNDLASGVYFLQLNNTEGTKIIKKFIKS